MKDLEATVVTRPDEYPIVHRQTTQMEYHNNRSKRSPGTAKNVLEHIMEKVKLGILLASVPVLTLSLVGLCVISIGMQLQQYRITPNALDV